MSDFTAYTVDEFESESRHIETLIWEAMMVEPNARVLFCGYGPDGRLVKRAIDCGAQVTVIEHRPEMINAFAKLGATQLRGSTSVIPAKESSFDLAISFHYLHEIDPFFHGQVMSELARVARRIAVVEPAPPADPLGKRIAMLYSQAKRELGQFEYYQPLEYWKKLLQAVKADVSQHVFAFGKVPPREYLDDTVKLLLDTMEVEEAPPAYMDELRAIAQRSDVQLLPPPRYVLVGAAAGELPTPVFTGRPTQLGATPPRSPAAAHTSQPMTTLPFISPAAKPGTISPDAGYEFPPVDPPSPSSPPRDAAATSPPDATPAVPAPPATPPPSDPFGLPITAPPAFTPGLPFGAPPPPDTTLTPTPSPFGAPFAISGESPFGVPPEGSAPPSSWQWEPPDPTREP